MQYNANKKKPKTNNQNKNIETTLPQCLGKALLFKLKKLREGEQKKTISPGQVQSAPKLCDLEITGAHRASATPSQLQDLAHESRHY